MIKDNILELKKAKSMCLLYGIASLLAGLVSFAVLEETGLGSFLVVIAILGFWRISHKIKFVLNAEEPKFFKDAAHNKDAHGR